jgi:hypothetical protein
MRPPRRCCGGRTSDQFTLTPVGKRNKICVHVVNLTAEPHLRQPTIGDTKPREIVCLWDRLE